MACSLLQNSIRTMRSFGLRSFTTTISRKQDVIDYPDSKEIQIPSYPKKFGESLESKRARLLYQSRKRGMLENDLLFSTFAAKYLKDMNESQLELYDKLVRGPSNDWDIYYWATDKKPIPDEYNNEVMDMFKLHVKNVNKEQRLRQPSLY